VPIDTTGNTNRQVGSIAIRISVTRGAADPGVGRAAFPLRPVSGIRPSVGFATQPVIAHH
jgi:hypothetical protein